MLQRKNPPIHRTSFQRRRRRPTNHAVLTNISQVHVSWENKKKKKLGLRSSCLICLGTVVQQGCSVVGFTAGCTPSGMCYVNVVVDRSWISCTKLKRSWVIVEPTWVLIHVGCPEHTRQDQRERGAMISEAHATLVSCRLQLTNWVCCINTFFILPVFFWHKHLGFENHQRFFLFLGIGIDPIGIQICLCPGGTAKMANISRAVNSATVNLRHTPKYLQYAHKSRLSPTWVTDAATHTICEHVQLYPGRRGKKKE